MADLEGGVVMDFSGEIRKSEMGHFALFPMGGAEPVAGLRAEPTIVAQANVPEGASLAMGVVCAIVGWWMVDRMGSKEPKANRVVPVKSKRQ